MNRFRNTPYRVQIGNPPAGRHNVVILETLLIQVGEDLKLHLLVMLTGVGTVYEVGLILKTGTQKREGAAARGLGTFEQLCAVCQGVDLKTWQLNGFTLDVSDPGALDDVMTCASLSVEFGVSKAGFSFMTAPKAVSS
jgi:hypothetical protein